METTCQLCGDYEESINHMLFHCRVAKEIWEHSPSRHLSGNHLSSNDLSSNVAMLMDLNKEPASNCPLHPFFGWRIWKMRNNLIFNEKRELIPDIINKAIMD